MTQSKKSLRRKSENDGGSSLARPQMISWAAGEWCWIFISETNVFCRRTHDGQGGGLGQFALDTFQHLQSRAVQFAAVDGAVAWADPVKLLGVKVNRETWETETDEVCNESPQFYHIQSRQRHRRSRTDRALLVCEEDGAVVAICVGHADVISICPVEFPGGRGERKLGNKNKKISPTSNSWKVFFSQSK